MFESQLSSEELEVLRDLLKHKIDEMDLEVRHTDTRDFKEKVKHRREILQHIADKFAAVPVS